MSNKEYEIIEAAKRENLEKVEKAVKDGVMRLMIERKKLERQRDDLDEAVSAIDKKIVDLADGFEKGDFLEASEVRDFLKPNTLAIDLGVDEGDFVYATLPGGDMARVKRKVSSRV